jgi:hypothetical protein
MREVHSGECPHTYVEWLPCDECAESDEPHEFAICLDCGHDMEQ